ncbi:MAG: type II toxin-antitoxin system MqsA family antitoxin [Armatimonadota bacterium]|nr:type II toxin-antitoxin system MqsA family antitoxin [Armatimonadota bacterium]
MKFKCVYCGGTVRDSVTTNEYNWGGKHLVIFKNVPCGVCDRCGERYFEGTVEHQMDLLAQPFIKRAKRASKKPLAVIDFAAQGVLESPVGAKS